MNNAIEVTEHAKASPSSDWCNCSTEQAEKICMIGTGVFVLAVIGAVAYGIYDSEHH